MIEGKIDRSLSGSEAILDQCANSPNACVKSGIEGAYRMVYKPVGQEDGMHGECYLALFHVLSIDYPTRPLGIQRSDGKEYPFWFNQ